MLARRYDLTIEQGKTFRVSFLDRDASGNPIDYTGWTGELQIRQILQTEPPTFSATPLLTLTTPSGSLSIDGPNGKVSIMLTPSQTAGLPIQRCAYELKLTSGDGTDVWRACGGSVAIVPQVAQ